MKFKTLRQTSDKIQKRYGSSGRRTVHITGVSSTLNLLLGLGKVISGVLALSVFACMNGGYTLGMALARYCALIPEIRKSTETGRSFRYYQMAALIMIAASLLYVGYSLWSIWHPRIVVYDKILAITIAAITFTEIGLNLWGVFRYRKAATPLLHVLKTISLATSLISLVLTQAAILSFADETQNPSVNGILGTLMGVIAALLGCYLSVRMRRLKKQEEPVMKIKQDSESNIPESCFCYPCNPSAWRSMFSTTIS